MKRLLTLLMAVLMLGTLTIPVFADGNTTTLTTTVPEAEYTMTIPEDMEVAFGTTEVDIGQVNITPVKGFTSGKGVEVDISHKDFSSSGVETTIPFKVEAWSKSKQYCLGETSEAGVAVKFRSFSSGDSLMPYYISGSALKTVDECHVILEISGWENALAGDYSATVTFTAKVIVV